MQNIFTNIKCSEIILYNANENWYILLHDLFSRLCYIATCGPFCKDATHIGYEPAGLTVHPPKMIEGGFIFFVWMSSATKIFSLKKSGFCSRY